MKINKFIKLFIVVIISIIFGYFWAYKALEETTTDCSSIKLARLIKVV